MSLLPVHGELCNCQGGQGREEGGGSGGGGGGQNLRLQCIYLFFLVWENDRLLIRLQYTLL